MEYPKKGEIVVAKVTKVLGFGAIVKLPEYNDIEGFVHISNVASGWIKNIRNFVKPNQIRAAEVLSINEEKNQIDLSFKKLSESEEKKRLDLWSQDVRNKKLIEVIAKKSKKSFDVAWQEVAKPLISEYGSLNAAFNEIAMHKESAVTFIPEKWKGTLIDIISKNVKIPKRTIEILLSIKSLEPDGLDVIKGILQKALNSVKDADIGLFYIGSGKFSLRATSTNPKIAEKAITSFTNVATKEAQTKHATIEFHKRT